MSAVVAASEKGGSFDSHDVGANSRDGDTGATSPERRRTRAALVQQWRNGVAAGTAPELRFALMPVAMLEELGSEEERAVLRLAGGVNEGVNGDVCVAAEAAAGESRETPAQQQRERADTVACMDIPLPAAVLICRG